MIKFLKSQWILILFVASLFTFHWFSKDITNPYQKPIVGDGQAYYAYLPALFIYQDLEYNFIEEHAFQYYPEGQFKDFVKEVEGGEKVNKTFPGVAVLYAPFFFAAHASAYVFGFEPDGFSNIYQLFYDLGLWFYFLFGLIFMRKLLEKLNFSSNIAILTTILIGICTNVFFYTVYDQSTTHIYNFFMINATLLSLMCWEEQKKDKWLMIAVALLVLIVITRPTNFLVFGLIVLFFGKKDFFLGVYRSIFSKNWWKFTIVGLPILMIPFLLWKAQTGNWVVYSYGEEGFNFADPYFGSFLFSYMKGWMTYTPVVIPILVLGLILLFKKSKKQFAIALSFYLISIYIFSSWWCWYYGAGMSQRVMIDHYILLAFLLALILEYIWDKKIVRASALVIFALFATFNVVQAVQVFKGIYKFGSPTKQEYWDNFLVLEKRARVYPPDHWQVIERVSMSPAEYETSVSAAAPFSATFEEDLTYVMPGSKLVISWDSYAKTEIGDTRAYLIFEYQEDSLEEVVPFFLNEFSQEEEWVHMEFLYEPTLEFSTHVKVYFWNGYTSEEAQFKNVKIDHYYSEEYY